MKVKLTEFVKYHEEDFDNALKIVQEKKIQISKEEAAEFYKVHQTKPFYLVWVIMQNNLSYHTSLGTGFPTSQNNYTIHLQLVPILLFCTI